MRSSPRVPSAIPAQASALPRSLPSRICCSPNAPRTMATRLAIPNIHNAPATTDATAR
jgi:hypothetical protein